MNSASRRFILSFEEIFSIVSRHAVSFWRISPFLLRPSRLYRAKANGPRVSFNIRLSLSLSLFAILAGKKWSGRQSWRTGNWVSGGGLSFSLAPFWFCWIVFCQFLFPARSEVSPAADRAPFSFFIFWHVFFLWKMKKNASRSAAVVACIRSPLRMKLLVRPVGGSGVVFGSFLGRAGRAPNGWVVPPTKGH